jgi:Cu/Ag efflux pump CusA
MLNLIIKTALNNRLAVVTIAIAMMIYGVMQARQSPIDVLPDLTRPRVVLITECPGLAPEEVETLVTFPSAHGRLSMFRHHPGRRRS